MSCGTYNFVVVFFELLGLDMDNFVVYMCLWCTCTTGKHVRQWSRERGKRVNLCRRTPREHENKSEENGTGYTCSVGQMKHET